MSLPQESGYDDEVLTRYVLGLLPDADRERVDEASIADDEVASRLRIAETDLMDGYVRGTLGGETRKQFESYYLSSPRRRESVRSAASFLRAIDRAAARADAETAPNAASGAAAERHVEVGPEPRVSGRMAIPSKLVRGFASVAWLWRFMPRHSTPRKTQTSPRSSSTGLPSVNLLAGKSIGLRSRWTQGRWRA